MLNYKRINSASFFEIAVPIYRLGEVVDMHSPDTWGLTDRYQIAAIDLLNSRNATSNKLQIAWNEQGLFLAGCLEGPAGTVLNGNAFIRCEWRIHSRYRRELRDWDQYCAAYRFLHPVEFPGGLIESTQLGEPVAPGKVKNPIDWQRSTSPDVFSQVIRTGKQLRFWMSARASSLPEYRPLEFPDLSMGLDVMESGGVELSLAQLGAKGNPFDPSGWFHCFCVE